MKDICVRYRALSGKADAERLFAVLERLDECNGFILVQAGYEEEANPQIDQTIAGLVHDCTRQCAELWQTVRIHCGTQTAGFCWIRREEETRNRSFRPKGLIQNLFGAKRRIHFSAEINPWNCCAPEDFW